MSMSMEAETYAPQPGGPWQAGAGGFIFFLIFGPMFLSTSIVYMENGSGIFSNSLEYV